MNNAERGFSLLEVLVAMIVLILGLVIGTELIHTASTSASLAGAQGNAAIVAQSKMAALMDSYNRDPGGADVSIGVHGPEEVRIANPGTGTIYNCFRVSWTISDVSDPRPGKRLAAIDVRVKVIPSDLAGNDHAVAGMNKIVVLSSIFSWRFQ